MKRDSHSNALLETDTNELQRYRLEKRREREMAQVKADVKKLHMCINRLTEIVQKYESNINGQD
jgi:hypothetical protein